MNLEHTVSNVRRAWAGSCQDICSLSPLWYQGPIRDTERPPLVFVLEDEAFMMYQAISDHSTCAMSIRRPVCNRDRTWIVLSSIVFGCRMLGNNIVRHHSPCIANVELAREMVVVGEFVKAVAKSRPSLANIGLNC